MLRRLSGPSRSTAVPLSPSWRRVAHSKGGLLDVAPSYSVGVEPTRYPSRRSWAEVIKPTFLQLTFSTAMVGYDVHAVVYTYN